MIKIHRWLGLCLALLLLIQGSTGITLVFRDEIEPVIHEELRVTPAPTRVSMQGLIAAVQAAHPDALVTRAEIPLSPDQTVLFKLKRHSDQAPILTAIDPFSGKIVRDGDLSAWPVEWLFFVHEQLLAGPVGEYIIGVEGIILLMMSVSGLWVWWPGRARFKNGFRVAWRGNRDLRWRTLHRAAGAAVGPILVVTALTGILMVWKEPLRDLLGAEGKPAPTVAERPGQPLIPVDDLVARAQADFGGARLNQIRFSNDGRVVAVYLDSDRSIRPDGTAQYYYNRYDGRQIGTYIAGEQSRASEGIDWIYTVHTGLWGGWLGRLLLLTGGVVLVGLSLTGPWLWYSRRTRRKSPRRTRTAAVMNFSDQ